MRIMLRAIQVLGSSSSPSSGFVFFCALRKPTHPNSTLSFISINPFSASFNSTSPLLLSGRRRTCTGFRMYPSYRRYSNPAGTSSSSPSGGVASCSSASSASIQPTIGVHKIKFCQSCGGPMKHEVPNGEERERAICTVCERIAYENPKMVVGCLIEHDNKILLCKRNIQPSHGLWTLPAGYLEMGESTVDGAMRETLEEAGAEVEIISPFTQLDIPLIGQTYIIFLAKLKRPHFSPGPESSECRLFELGEIPFESLAFSSMLVTLELFIEDRKAGKPMFHYGIINKRYSLSISPKNGNHRVCLVMIRRSLENEHSCCILRSKKDETYKGLFGEHHKVDTPCAYEFGKYLPKVDVIDFYQTLTKGFKFIDLYTYMLCSPNEPLEV